MANVTIFTPLFEHIDSAVETVVGNGSQNLIQLVSPIMLSCFLAYLILVFVGYWQGTTEQNLGDLFKRVAAWAVVLTVSLNLSGYNEYVLPLVQHMGDGFSQTFVGNATSSATALDAVVNQIADLLDKNMLDALDSAPAPLNLGSVIGAVFQNVIIMICAGLFLVIAAAYIVLTKVFLSILAIVGPIFLACFLFPSTRQLASAWVMQVLNYSLLILLLNVSASIFINFIKTILDDATVGSGVGGAAASTVLTTAALAQICLTCALFYIVILKLPELASGLSGGIAANGFGSAFNAMKSMATRGKGGKSSSSSSSGGSIKGAKQAEDKGK